MVVGEMPEGLDFVVIGAGPGGYTAALEAAAAGRSVTIIDRIGTEGIGGTCLLEGCIPSKALIETADLRSRALSFADSALGFDAAPIDMGRFQSWKDSVVTTLSRGVHGRLKSAGVDVVTGSFCFTGANRGVIEIGGDSPPQHIEFEDAVIAVGSTAIEISPLPFDGARVYDAAGILDLDELAADLVVVGGGYIGVEIGTAMRKLGSTVTIVEATDSILPGMPPSAVKQVTRRADALGIEVLTGHSARGLSASGVEVVDGTGAERSIDADAVLVSVGRRPATRQLGLAAAGIRTDEAGLIPVDAGMRATTHIAAVGDVVSGPALAHKAIAEAKVAASALCGQRAELLSTVVPLVVFSDPEIAVVGLDETSAKSAGIRTSAVRMPFRASGRAATMGAVEGSVELVVDLDTHAVVGGVLVGAHVSELIGEVVLAIEMAATPEDLALSVHPHPTVSEMIPDTAANFVPYAG